MPKYFLKINLLLFFISGFLILFSTNTQAAVCGDAPIGNIQLMMALDHSGSIGADIAQVKSKAIDFVNNFLSDPALNNRAGVVWYSDDAILAQTLTNNISSLVYAINNGMPGFGQTYMEKGLNLAINELVDNAGSNPKAIVHLTDGIANNPSLAIQAFNDAKSQNIRVINIGLGSDIDNNFLKNNASQDCAVSSFTPACYWRSPTTGELALIYLTIIGNLLMAKDMDKDGYISIVCGGNDCNDFDPNMYPGQPCDDGKVCSTNDVCDNSGVCAGAFTAGQPCDDGSTCTTNDYCNTSGSCISDTPMTCSDDGNPCTTESCVAPVGCNSSYNSNPCDDGNPCTVGDTCGGGNCLPGSPKVCNTPPNSQCQYALGSCDSSGNCVYGSKPDDIACDSGIPCVLGSCSGGVCTSGSNICGGLVPCGRMFDDPATADIDEHKPCSLCHIFVLLDNIIDFLLLRVLLSLALLMVIIAGLLYIGSVLEILPTGFEIIGKAKLIIVLFVIGFVIIFAAFVAVGTFLKLVGLADWTTNIYQDWWTNGLFRINCQISATTPPPSSSPPVSLPTGNWIVGDIPEGLYTFHCAGSAPDMLPLTCASLSGSTDGCVSGWQNCGINVEASPCYWDTHNPVVGCTLATKCSTAYQACNCICGGATPTPVQQSPVPGLPQIFITFPSSGQTVSSPSITVRGTASGNGLSKVEVKVGTGAWQMALGTTSWSKSISLASGSNTIYVKATDASGNIKETSVTVTYTPSASAAGDVKIWDTKVKETTWLGMDFTISASWANKASWVQVPYGTTNYNFIGETVIENDNFWIFMQSRSFSPFMFGKKFGMPSGTIELYSTAIMPDGTGRMNKYKTALRILKNTIDEASIWVDGSYIPNTNLMTYTVKKDSPALTMASDNNYRYISGVHSGGRYGVAPSNDGIGSDFVVDAALATILQANGGNKYYLPAGKNNFMMQGMFGANPNSWLLMVTYPDPIIAKPYITTSTGDGTTKRFETMRAEIQKGQINDVIYVAAINHPGSVMYLVPNTYLSAGSNYTTSLRPLVPGRWRMSGRVDGLYYTSDVYGDGNFVFTMPVSGTLEFLAMYLYDRTGATPANVETPMDIYRKTR